MSYKQTFLQFPRLGQSVDGSPLIRDDLAVELAGDADKEIAALQAQLAAQSRTLAEKTQQVEGLRAALAALLPVAQEWAEMAGALPEYRAEFREAQRLMGGGA